MDGSESNENVLNEMEKHELIKPAIEYFRKENNKKLLNRLIMFHSSDDREKLVSISKDSFADELKQVKHINKEINNPVLRQIIPTDWLILTVGLRKEPLIISILLASPQKVFLMHTSQSKKTAQEVEDHFSYAPHIKFHCRQVDEVDPSRLYEETKIIFDKAGKEGKRLAFDPTGGRKAMSAGAAAVSFYYSIPMIYLHGYEKMGIMMPFTEQLKLIPNPYDKFGDIELRIVLELANRYNFIEAKDTISLISTNKPINLRGQLSILSEIMKVYHDWDRFKHSDKDMKPGFSRKLQNAITTEGFALLKDCVIKQIKSNVQFLEKLELNWKQGSRDMVGKYRIIDLYSNIMRRKKQGKYEEAVALCYRLFEMLPRYVLHSKFPKKEISSTIKNKELGDLLGIEHVDDPDKKVSLATLIKCLVKAFPDDKSIEKLNDYYQETLGIKEGRNASIYGHGTQPISKEEFDEIKIIVEKAIKLFLSNEFSQLVDQSTFPDFLDC